MPYEQINDLFTTSINRKKIEQCMVKEIRRLSGDASVRKYFKVITNKGNYVACMDDGQSGHSMKSGLPFVGVQQIFLENGIRVPLIFDYIKDSGYVLQEYLGEVSFLKKLASIDTYGEEFEIYSQAVDVLIKIHNIDIKKYKKHELTSLRFDEEKLLSEVFFSFEHFIEGFCNHQLNDDSKDELLSFFKKICGILSSYPMVCTHRDYHSRNIMVKDGDLIILDFQDARLGIPQYDLVSLLDDGYYSLQTANIERLKKKYWNQFLKQLNIQESYEQFLYLYDLMLIQRTFKIIGTFSFLAHKNNGRQYIKNIGYAFEKLRQILFMYQEFTVLRKRLSAIFYEH